MEKVRIWISENKKEVGRALILVGIVAAVAINLLW